MAYVILNANCKRWGADTYPTEQAARDELKAFWKGVKGVRLDRFYVVPESEADGQAVAPGSSRTAAR